MKVLIKDVKLTNFKGEKELAVDFGYETFILGGNGVGKTTVLDAILWCMFEKDSKGRKNFELKTLDKDGKQIHGLIHSVKVTLIVDGAPIEFERTLKEKWTKKKGEAEKKFSGHVSGYAINEIPVSKDGYTSKINEIINEEIFKQVTNVNYFTSLQASEQREVLGNLVGEVTSNEVIKSNIRLLPLSEFLNKMDVSDLRRKLKIQGERFKEEILLIPPRIDECNNQIVVCDVDELELEKANVVNEIKELKGRNNNRNELLIKKSELRERLYTLKDKFRNLDNNSLKAVRLNEERHSLTILEQQVKELDFKINSGDERIKTLEITLKELKDSNDIFEITQEKLRNDFRTINNGVFEFSPEDRCCPTCFREYDGETLKKLINNGERVFEEQKDLRLKRINEEGKRIFENLNDVEKKIQGITNNINELVASKSYLINGREAINEDIKKSMERIALLNKEEEIFEGKEKMKNEISSIENEIDELNKLMPKDFSSEIDFLEERLENIGSRLLIGKRNGELMDRIKELENRSEELSIELANVEKLDFLCIEFIRERVRIIEKRFNEKFKNIRFKLFKEQINGGITECCEVTSDGVPYSNLNTASQVNCGLEIINVLNEHYDFYAPIFIDNRESINEIIPVKTQVINFKVSTDENLVVKKLSDLSYGEDKPIKCERKLEF